MKNNSLECGPDASGAPLWSTFERVPAEIIQTSENGAVGQSAARPAHSKEIAPRLAALVFLVFLFSIGVTAQTPQATPPPAAAPRSVQFPKPTEKTLANGLRVIVIERRETPLVAAQLIVKNGAEVDQPELAGLANMTADLLTKGTKKRTATQIAEEIEALGASIDYGARWDASRVTLNVMSTKVSQAMEILADVVRNPTFKADEIERLRQQTIDDLTVEMGEPGSIARYVGSRVVFGDAPYGQPITGTPQTIARIAYQDLARFHNKYYRPDNAILVIGGDIKAADAFKLAQQLLGDWKKPADALPAMTTPKLISTGPRVVVVDKPDAGQAAVIVARTGIDRADPDYFSGIVTNSVLTGYSGRLNQEIRIKQGLSYGASSALDTRRYIGPFAASAQTKNLSAALVANLLLEEVKRLSSAPVPDVELNPRKAVVIGNFARNLETAGGLVAQIGSLALYGINFDQINSYISNVQSVGASDVQRFAGTRLDPKGIHVVIVGNAKEFLPELRKQFANVEVIPAAELDLNTARLRKNPGSARLK
ncbi:MAG TPA: pitrilysin family protein [Pyrinomonadaceae bacterium]|nr:pitrilysin family protein [Pyrinomonadaceae bacterium]